MITEPHETRDVDQDLPEEQRELLAEVAQERASSLSAADSDALFARIEGALDAARETERAPAKVLPFRGAGVTVAILAAAAAFVLVYGRRAPAPELQQATRAPLQEGSEIVEVDFGSNAGTHFTVEG